MDHMTIKQESLSEEMMDVGSDFNSPDFSSLGNVENLQLDIDLRKGMGDDVGRSTYAVVSTSSTQGNQIRLLSMPSNQLSDQHMVLQNNQIVFSTVDNQKPTTKLIIAKNAGGGPPQVLSVGPQGLQSISSNNRGFMTETSMANTTLSTSSNKTYVLTQSPQKTAVTTPTKYTIQPSRIALSPTKTPTRMIPVSSLQNTPQKIVQVAGQQYVMLTRQPSSQPSRSNTNPQSPSKVVIRGQAASSTSVTLHQQFATGSGQSIVRQSQAVSMANVPSNVQPLSMSGSKFQYVRLVTTPASQGQTTQVVSRPPTIAPAPQRVGTPVNNQIRLSLQNSNQNIIIQPKQSSQSQRLILPATSTIIGQRQAGTSNSLLSTSINPGQTISLQGLQGFEGFALIPAQYIPQSQTQQIQSAPIQTKPEHFQSSNQLPQPKQPPATVNGATAVSDSLPGQRPRKPCNCTKSQCLKLYCDCFANGEFCSNCNCNNCFNNLEHEEERQRAIKTCLERNPHAFHPKIGKGRIGGGDRRHNKGCNCKRSGCLKNYCECYEAKIMCSNLCKCVGCKNFEESPDRKTLMHLADAAEVRHQQQTNVKTKLSSQIQDLPVRSLPSHNGERLPYTFVTLEVAEATCACLVAQAEEAERTRQQEMMEERMILEEFGRCLMQVIQSSTRTKAGSHSSAVESDGSW